MSTPAIDPLTVACQRCKALAGQRCVPIAARPARTHAARRRDALAVAAHSDPVLDKVMPAIGPCGLCGVRGLPQRHRVIDAIASSLEAGENPEEITDDYALSLEAIGVVGIWMERWPGAWQ